MYHRLIQTAYPQALIKLINIIGNVNDAEDVLQTAVEKALMEWKANSPSSPVAWLITVARRQFIDNYRYQKKFIDVSYLAESLVEPDLSEQALLLSYNDDLLRLIFTCCHPSLNLATQTTLALKHLLGLSISQIANALLLNEKTVEQRLTRAKRKIQHSGIVYQVPTVEQWHQRLTGVMKTIYLLFNEGYFVTKGEHLVNESLCNEALRLAKLLQTAVKNNGEVIGLLALLLQLQARQPARVNAQGELVLLAQQQRQLWQRSQINQANVLIEKAIMLSGANTYTIQAAIAALHNNAANESETDWQQIHGLYQALLRLEPNPVIELNAAVVLAKCGDINAAIHNILALSTSLNKYRHFHSALAALYCEQKQWSLAYQYYQRALKLTDNKMEQSFFNVKIALCLEQLALSPQLSDTN